MPGDRISLPITCWIENVDATPVIILEDSLGTEFFVLFVRFPDDIVSQFEGAPLVADSDRRRRRR